MLQFQKKKKIKNMIYSKLALVLILFILFLFVKATASFYQKEVESQHRKEQAENELAELQKRKDSLEHKIKRLDSSVGVEEELRQRFDLVKDGEQTILIGDEKGSTSTENQ
jgi:cell division protein FtsB